MGRVDNNQSLEEARVLRPGHDVGPIAGVSKDGGEANVLFRVTDGYKEKLSTLVKRDDVARFNGELSTVMRSGMSSLKKKDRKAKKSRKAVTAKSEP